MSTLDERLAQRTSLGTWTFDNRFEYRAGLGRIYSAAGEAEPVICELCYYITSPGGTFTLRSAGSVSYEVDWGDGSSETSTSNNLAHTYAAGDYIIRITSAVVYRPYFNNSGDEDLITEIQTADISFGTDIGNAWFGANNMTRFNAAFGVTTGVTNFTNAWRNCTNLTSFPLIDTSSGTNFFGAWRTCIGLTSFPLINVSSGTNFSYAWYNCTNLTSFPLIDTSSGTNFQESWRACSGLTSFPLIDVSSGTNFYGAWYNCSGLTSFPLINVSSGAGFALAWYNCNQLTDFPANFFDSWTGTPATNCFVNAWTNCTSLTATSVENILNSIDTSGQSAPASGVGITIDYNAASGTPNISTAVTNLKSRGWTITLNGVAQ